MKDKIKKLTTENIKEGQYILLEPSFQIVKFLIDSLAKYKIRGQIVKGKQNENEILAFVGRIELVTNAKELAENELAYIVSDETIKKIDEELNQIENQKEEI